MGYSRLEPGRELEVREYISFQRGRDGFCELIECSVDELLERKAESIVREKELCQRIDAAVEVWSKQAQQTQQYMKALEYVKTPPTPHTSNRWTVNEYGNHEMSNMVYRFSWREYEHTEWDRTLEKSVPKSWELTWSVTFNTPHNPDYSGDGWKIAGQDRKIFRDRASMEKYLQGRIAAYADLFVEICPPIPTEHKDRFSINGQLMQGYMVATKEPERPDQGQVDALLDCLDDADMLEVPITFIALSTNDDIIMIDAEREYGELTRALQGAVLEISPSSPHHINPLDINRGYGAGENPVAMKSELMMSICEQQMGVGQLGAFHKSIIDRCTANIYHDFIKSGGEGRIPTLPDWRNEVKRQPEREAQELALASELFVEGSLNMFAHETNFDIDNRIVCFDLYEMGEQLKPTALNVVLETIQNRVAANRLAGRYTWVFVDEVYLFFKYYYSAQFLYKCWKRFRKYAAAMTAATQNIEECLRSETARLMLANSEFLILLNQAATDRAELAKLLHISETQMCHVTNVEAGHGLMRIGSSIIPFVNEFPRDGTLYRLMTTTPGDK